MKKLTLQLYIKESDKAVDFYQKAFGVELTACHKNPDGTIYHAEFELNGQTVALSESWFSETIKGNTMQFIFHLGEGNEAAIKKAYDVLKDEAKILHQLGSIGWSPLAFALIDKFGVSWCVAI